MPKIKHNMMLGRIDPELEAFIAHHKDYGFATRTDMANAAFAELRKKLSKKQRASWRKSAFEELSKSFGKAAFEGIDHEDFEK